MTNELRSDMALAAARRADGVIRDIASAGASHWSAEALDRGATVALGRWLQARAYGFTTGTPETHRRVLANGPQEARDLRDIFGWSRPFRNGVLPEQVRTLLERAGALQLLKHGLMRSRIRFSSLAGLLLVHSAYPTTAGDAVFFGPDTYRFAALIRATLAQRCVSMRHIVDIGCGSGAGGLLAAHLLGLRVRLTLADLSPAALRCAEINAELAGIEVSCRLSDVLASVEGKADLILSNPPYLADPQGRLYRNGGGAHGCELSLRIVRESLPRLAPGGRLVLYTGTAIVDGRDEFRHAVEPLLRKARIDHVYGELDPDVFGEELDQPAYADVERIAVVGLVARATGYAS